MIINELNVTWDNNGTFQDLSELAAEYGGDSFVLPLVALEDYLYLGLYKSFKQIYAELKVVNAIVQTFTAEYFNGSTWNNLENFNDQSKGLTRSGFMKWEKSEDWAKTTINSEELYWIRLKPSADVTPAMELQGLNIVFANDQDLTNEFSKVTDYLATDELSYITYHQSMRDDIVQSLRNKGNAKKSSASTSLQKITKWDLLDIEEVKKGAVYGVLSKIFFYLSDNPEDKWYQRHKDYEAKAKEALELYYLSLDTNDAGKVQSSEMSAYQGVSLFRQ